MIESPLTLHVLFHVGPVAITVPVVTTWALIAVITVASHVATRRLELRPGRAQAALEWLAGTLDEQIADVLQADGRRFLPLIGTLFLFLAVANSSGIAPGVHPPTAHLESAAALAAVVFGAVHYFGVRSLGWRGYLRTYLRPSPLLLPINILATFTRTFSLMVRLFGNIMSGEFLIAIVVALAGLFIPIPLMALEVLIGLVQAYIFTVLATVFIGAAVGASEVA
jgi:F-type H+-transporting ATPase subunit a